MHPSSPVLNSEALLLLSSCLPPPVVPGIFFFLLPFFFFPVVHLPLRQVNPQDLRVVPIHDAVVCVLSFSSLLSILLPQLNPYSLLLPTIYCPTGLA